jgi:succinate-acetate transporter protein
MLLLLALDITFALLGAFYYTGNAKLQTAGEYNLRKKEVT